VLGLVTSEYLYRQHPTEHEGQLTKTKSLLVSKAILSRRALAMGLGRFVLMSHSEIESGGRQRLSILADAFESVVGAIYLDQGFEAAREFIAQSLLRDSREIVADKRHTNFKSHLQEYVQSTYRTHPVYRIRSEMGPDHSKQFNVDVMVGKRVLGSGRGANKKEAEQAAARTALEAVETPRSERPVRERRPAESSTAAPAPTVEEPTMPPVETAESRRKRRGRRGGRGRRRDGSESALVEHDDFTPASAETPTPDSRPAPARSSIAVPVTPPRPAAPVRESAVVEPVFGLEERMEDEDPDEVGRPEGPLEERRVDPFGFEGPRERETARSVESGRPARRLEVAEPQQSDEPEVRDRDDDRFASDSIPARPDEPIRESAGRSVDDEEPTQPRPASPPSYGRRGGRGRR
jgi:ribonuclease III